ncbi:MAG: hypothetical protein ACI84C_002314 [Flavobacteriales bacterium]|jgi:hypothetical protein
MKRFFKILAKSILFLIALVLVAYCAFRGIEYATGGKYVDYLELNSETVANEDSFSFSTMEEDIQQNKVLLVGEIHGFDESCKFDLEFFKHIHANHNVRTYMAELDVAQAMYLNEFMRTGNDSTLKRILEKWAVVQGRNNQDYLDKYIGFHTFYQSLDSADRFTFYGVDKIQDWKLVHQLVNEKLSVDSNFVAFDYDKESVIADLKQAIEENLASQDPVDCFEELLANVKYYEEKVGREQVMFNNFESLYEAHSMSKEKVYGFFGSAHVFQYRVNGSHPLASLMRQSDLNLAGKIMSVNFLYVDSYMVMPSAQLPEFMRTGPDYSKMPISADAVLFMYIYGVNDFKRMTPENHKSILKFNGADSSYGNSCRLNTTIKILPIVPDMDLDDEGAEYLQYTVFVRNGDWAEPVSEQQ